MPQDVLDSNAIKQIATMQPFPPDAQRKPPAGAEGGGGNPMAAIMAILAKLGIDPAQLMGGETLGGGMGAPAQAPPQAPSKPVQKKKPATKKGD